MKERFVNKIVVTGMSFFMLFATFVGIAQGTSPLAYTKEDNASPQAIVIGGPYYDNVDTIEAIWNVESTKFSGAHDALDFYDAVEFIDSVYPVETFRDTDNQILISICDEKIDPIFNHAITV